MLYFCVGVEVADGSSLWEFQLEERTAIVFFLYFLTESWKEGLISLGLNSSNFTSQLYITLHCKCVDMYSLYFFCELHVLDWLNLLFYSAKSLINSIKQHKLKLIVIIIHNYILSLFLMQKSYFCSRSM